MSSQKTEHYELNQWLATDQVLRTDFNADNAKVDAALDILAGQVAEKADGADLTALEATVAGHTTQLGQLGNCEVDFFTYTGNGRHGDGNPTYISFSKPPELFLIMGGNYSAFGSRHFTRLFLDLSSNNAFATATWSGNRVAFVQSSAEWQLNRSGTTYYVVAFYAQNE